MKTDASWQQAAHLLTLVSKKGAPAAQIQKLYNSGLLSDLLDANVDEVDRDKFREVLGLNPFPKNEHGHYIIEVIGHNMTFAEEAAEIASFRANGFTLSDDHYEHLRLEEGRNYKVALVLCKEIKKSRTKANLRVYGEQFGYSQPFAGIITHIRELVTDLQMEQMGIEYIVGFCDPNPSYGFEEYIHCSECCVGKSFSDGYGEWRDSGAVAFVVPEA